MKFCLLILMSLLLACDKPEQTELSSQPLKVLESAVTLQGMVSDNSGYLKYGIVTASTLSGKQLASFTLTDNSRYQFDIPVGSELPIILSFSYPATVAIADKLICVIVQPGISKYDINPLTTQIAKQAKALGGYTLHNMIRAAGDSVNVPDGNKTSTGFRGDPTTQYGGWH